jgi:hypothetical protein
MALSTQISTASRSAACDAITALIGASATVKIYTGSAPTHTSDAATGTLLGTLTMSATPFGAASSGVATANSITSDTSADASGTAGYFRVSTSGGTVIFQGTCGTASTNMVFDNATIVAGGTIAITSMTLTVPENGS